MKTTTTMYQVLLATNICDVDATHILTLLEIEKKATLAFEPGTVLMTWGVQSLHSEEGFNTLPYLVRHLVGDWGDMKPANYMQNTKALQDEEPLLSIYCIDEEGEKYLYIYTTADRQQTTMMLSYEAHFMGRTKG